MEHLKKLAMENKEERENIAMQLVFSSNLLLKFKKFQHRNGVSTSGACVEDIREAVSGVINLIFVEFSLEFLIFEFFVSYWMFFQQNLIVKLKV